MTPTSAPDGEQAHPAAVGASTVSVVDPALPTLVDTLEVPRAGDPGAHGLAYITGA